MNTLNSIRNFAFAALVLAFVMVVPAHGQVTMTSTTTSAILNGTATCFNVAAATGIVAPSFNTPNQPTGNQTLLVIDQEAIFVSQISGTYVCGIRGYAKTTAAAHVSGAKVWVAPPAAFAAQDPQYGQCVRTQLPYVPIVSLATGNTFDCMGLTTAGRIVKTNSPGVPVLGSAVTAATSITPTGTMFTLSGATTVATIVVPQGWAPGMCLAIVPGATGATTTGGNIGLTTSAFVVGRINTFCWSGSLWYPSYVS